MDRKNCILNTSQALCPAATQTLLQNCIAELSERNYRNPHTPATMAHRTRPASPSDERPAVRRRIAAPVVEQAEQQVGRIGENAAQQLENVLAVVVARMDKETMENRLAELSEQLNNIRRAAERVREQVIIFVESQLFHIDYDQTVRNAIQLLSGSFPHTKYAELAREYNRLAQLYGILTDDRRDIITTVVTSLSYESISCDLRQNETERERDAAREAARVEEEERINNWCEEESDDEADYHHHSDDE